MNSNLMFSVFRKQVDAYCVQAPKRIVPRGNAMGIGEVKYHCLLWAFNKHTRAKTRSQKHSVRNDAPPRVS